MLMERPKLAPDPVYSVYFFPPFFLPYNMGKTMCFFHLFFFFSTKTVNFGGSTPGIKLQWQEGRAQDSGSCQSHCRRKRQGATFDSELEVNRSLEIVVIVHWKSKHIMQKLSSSEKNRGHLTHTWLFWCTHHLCNCMATDRLCLVTIGNVNFLGHFPMPRFSFGESEIYGTE